MLDNREHMLDKHKLLLTLENRFWCKLTLCGSLSQAHTWKNTPNENPVYYIIQILTEPSWRSENYSIWLAYTTQFLYNISAKFSAWCKSSPFPISFLLSSVLVSSMGSTGWGEFKQCTEPREEIQPASRICTIILLQMMQQQTRHSCLQTVSYCKI